MYKQAAESLRTFALAHNEVAFAHMVSAALATPPEAFAVERVSAVLDLFSSYGLNGVDTDTVTTKLEVIRSTDTTRPDGAIARSFTP